MLTGLGTVKKLISKLLDDYSKEWYGYRKENSEEAEGVIFQQWMEREGRQAGHQKILKMNTDLVHGPAGGAGVSGSGAQK